MPWPQSAAPDLHLERAGDCVGRSRTAWCTDYWRGECPALGWCGEVIYTFTAVWNSQKRWKTGGFAHVLAYKSPKTPFFAQKYFTRYTHETFFEEYTNFQAHYLSHCRVILLQSLGSHIRPQPHGLGLKDEVCSLRMWIPCWGDQASTVWIGKGHVLIMTHIL
jgi:hypothetical protein